MVPFSPRSLLPSPSLPPPGLSLNISTSNVGVDGLENLKVTTAVTNTGDETPFGSGIVPHTPLASMIPAFSPSLPLVLPSISTALDSVTISGIILITIHRLQLRQIRAGRVLHRGVELVHLCRLTAPSRTSIGSSVARRPDTRLRSTPPPLAPKPTPAGPILTISDVSSDELPINPTVATPHETSHLEDGDVEGFCENTHFHVTVSTLSFYSPPPDVRSDKPGHRRITQRLPSYSILRRCQ